MEKKRKFIFHKIQISKQNKEPKRLNKHGGVSCENFFFIYIMTFFFLIYKIFKSFFFFNMSLDPQKAIGFETEEVKVLFTERDSILYSLGIGYS